MRAPLPILTKPPKLTPRGCTGLAKQMNEAFLENDAVHKCFDLTGLPEPLRHAYNPAIFEYDGKQWMFVRTGAFRTSEVHLVRVEGNQLHWCHRMLARLPWWKRGDILEDFRFFTHLGEPYASHTYAKTSLLAGLFRAEPLKIYLLHLIGRRKLARERGVFRLHMAYSRLTDSLQIQETNCFKGSPNKNWQFFSNGTDLFAVEHIYPKHVVSLISKDRVVRRWKTATPAIYGMQFGQIRGGTPPISYGGKYWSFFHSMAEDSTGRYYFAGIYTFETKPPFKVLQISTKPVLFPTDNSPDITHMPHPGLRYSYVIFPAGAIREGLGIRMTYGMNDARSAQIVLTFAHLETHLTAVPA